MTKKRKDEKEKLYKEENKQNKGEIEYDAEERNKIKEKVDALIKLMDDEIGLLKALNVEDAELNDLLLKIKNKKNEKEKLSEK